MLIIAYLGTSVKEYLEKAQGMVAGLGMCCPKHPEKRMAFHDTYPRTIKETGEKIDIQRLICYECRSTIAILPDFLLPNKHYSANEIESVILQSEAGSSVYDIDTAAAVCTVRRWLSGIPEKLTEQVSKLKSLAIENYACPISEVTHKDLSLMEQIRHISQRLPKIRYSGNLLGYAGIYSQSLAAANST